MPPEPIRVHLSDAQWLSLLDGSADRLGLQACCANIAALRDIIYRICRNGGEVTEWTRSLFIERLGHAMSGSHQLENAPALFDLMRQMDMNRPPQHRPAVEHYETEVDA